jgi:mannose-1-phosphate guanylyltransferase
VVPLDSEGRVEAFIEKPEPGTAPTNWINAGTYVLEPTVLTRIPDGEKVSIERVVFPAMAAEKNLYGMRSDAYWIDAGTTEAYLGAQMDLIDGTRGTTEVAVDPTAVVHSSADVERSVLGSDVTVGEDCQVANSIVMDGAILEAGAVVTDSIVGRFARIGKGSVVADLSVIGNSAEVADGSKVSEGRIPPPETWPPK